MSQELIQAGVIRENLAAKQAQYPDGLPVYSTRDSFVEQLGRLVGLDPLGASLVADTIHDPGLRVNALVRVTDAKEAIEPIVDAWEVVLTEVTQPERKSRRLAFVANHALEHDPGLALTIARDIETPTTRAKTLLTIAGRTQDAALLEEVDSLAAHHRLGRKFDEKLMGNAESLHYRVGMNACERVINAKLAKGDPQGLDRHRYNLQDAERESAAYTSLCIYDAYERQDYSRLIPIAEEVATAFSWYAEPKIRTTGFGGATPFGAYRRTGLGFKPIVEAYRIAEAIIGQEPEVSLQLLRAVRQMINNRIKTLPPIIKAKRTPPKESEMDGDFLAEIAELEIPIT